MRIRTARAILVAVDFLIKSSSRRILPIYQFLPPISNFTKFMLFKALSGTLPVMDSGVSNHKAHPLHNQLKNQLNRCSIELTDI